MRAPEKYDKVFLLQTIVLVRRTGCAGHWGEECSAGSRGFLCIERETYGRVDHEDQRGGQRHRLGAHRAGAAVLHRPVDDIAHRRLPVPPGGPLDAAHHWRGVHQQGGHRPHQQRGHGHQPVPEHVHGAGGHHWHRQHRGCGHGHRLGRAGRHLLDVGHGHSGHDDQLCGKRAGRVLPPQK